jgi:hypothetical protein
LAVQLVIWTSGSLIFSESDFPVASEPDQIIRRNRIDPDLVGDVPWHRAWPAPLSRRTMAAGGYPNRAIGAHPLPIIMLWALLNVGPG